MKIKKQIIIKWKKYLLLMQIIMMRLQLDFYKKQKNFKKEQDKFKHKECHRRIWNSCRNKEKY